MKSLFNVVLTAFIALALVGCKTILPHPATSDSTLVLAPYAADNQTKQRGAWAYAYILNNNEDLLVRIDARRADDLFTVTEDLAEGEYLITGIKMYPVSAGRTNAVGEGNTVQIEKENQIPFTTKAGEITIIPLMITLYTKMSPDRQSGRQHHKFDFLSEEEISSLKLEAEQLEGFDSWSNNG